MVGKVGDEVINFCSTHVTGMAFFVIKDILAHPGEVSLFGAEGIVTVAQDFAVLIEKLFSALGCIRRRCQGQ